MDEKRRIRRDFWQNTCIALLSLSAAFLFTQTQLYHLGRDFLQSHFHVSAPAVPSTSQLRQLPAAPVKIAITGEYGPEFGRYGIGTLTTAEEFLPLRTLLSEALGSARNYAACGAGDFLAALQGSCVYYDFLHPLPLSVLSDFSAESAGEDVIARYVIVAGEKDGVFLYLWDGDALYFRSQTMVVPNQLAEVIRPYELGNAVLAMDGDYPQAEKLLPCSILPKTPADLPVLSAANPVWDEQTLLLLLNFNPRVKSRYTEQDGTEVIVEGDRSLRLRPDGSFHYQNGGEDPLTISSGEETPTFRESAAGAGTLLQSLTAGLTGDATLYLRSIHRTGSDTVLSYGYQLSGTPIHFSNAEPAATIHLSENQITSLDLNMRQYTPAADASLLLPLTQAVAVAANHAGAELSISYVDDGSGTLSAKWLTE